MYTDDYSDKESEYEERSPDDSRHIIKKSLSTVGFRNNLENVSARPLALRATQSFTGTAEDRLCGSLRRVNVCARVAPTEVIPPACPCGCPQRRVVGPFRTREQTTLALHVVPPDVLDYHGYSFDPSQIAMFWKKDCRMFLWKGKARMKDVIRADFYK